MTFGEVLWSLLIIYCMVIYFILLFRVIVDLFRDDQTGGFVKAVWIFCLFFFPFITLLVYVIARGKGMAERNMKAYETERAAQDQYIRDVAGTKSNAADQIAKAHELYNSGAISQSEFDTLKSRALA